MSCDPNTLLAQATPFGSLTQEQLVLITISTWVGIVAEGVMAAGDFRITELGDFRITEAGDRRILE